MPSERSRPRQDKSCVSPLVPGPRGVKFKPRAGWQLPGRGRSHGAPAPGGDRVRVGDGTTKRSADGRGAVAGVCRVLTGTLGSGSNAECHGKCQRSEAL